MKKVIFLAIFIIISVKLYSQDNEPEQLYMNINGSSIQINPQDNSFRQTEFLFGWHWDSYAKISQALMMNQNDISSKMNDISYEEFYAKINSNATHLCVKNQNYKGWTPVNDVYTHGDNTQYLNARAVQYEPTLFVNSYYDSISNEFIPQSYDNIIANSNLPHKNSVFGFGYIHPLAIDSSGILKITNSIPAGDTVLKKAWKTDKFDYGDGTYLYAKDTRYAHYPKYNIDYAGGCYYLTFNIKRLDNLGAGDTILKIEMPYIDKNNVADRFIIDSIPSPNTSDTIRITYQLDNQTFTRGLSRKLSRTTSAKKYFAITKSMLPVLNTTYTISATIRFYRDKLQYSQDSVPDPFQNPRIIRNFDIVVRYMGNSSVDLDWIRLETPHARKLFRGAFDWKIRGYHNNDDLGNIERDINNLSYSDSAVGKNTRYFRSVSVIERNYLHWGAERYFNKLIGSIGVGETAPDMPLLFEHYVKPSDRWLSLFSLKANISCPYLKNFVPKNLRYRTNNNILGYKQKYIGSTEQPTWVNIDTLNSEYETWLVPETSQQYLKDHNDNINSTMIKNLFWSDNSKGKSIQSFWDAVIYKNFYHNYVSGFQYSNKFWWSQSFIETNWRLPDEDKSATKTYYSLLDSLDYGSIDTIESPNHKARLALLSSSHTRFYTGEEVRLVNWLPLIMGAKGLLYDGGYDQGSHVKFCLLYTSEAETVS